MVGIPILPHYLLFFYCSPNSKHTIAHTKISVYNELLLRYDCDFIFRKYIGIYVTSFHYLSGDYWSSKRLNIFFSVVGLSLCHELFMGLSLMNQVLYKVLVHFSSSLSNLFFFCAFTSLIGMFPLPFPLFCIFLLSCACSCRFALLDNASNLELSKEEIQSTSNYYKLVWA